MLGRVTSAALKARGTLSATELAPLAITMGDFEAGLEKVQPSAKREGFATIPDVEWADVGALGELRAELQMAIVEPIRRPERFEALGLQPSCGVLLYGPPGCGKTLVAKAIANECGASFIAVRGPELLNKYVGESEKAVRQLFARGRASAPCVVFFDEIDALTPRRGGEGTSQATERVVNQMLTELDGLDGRTQLFFVAATNRPDILDPAMLRPGRLDKLLYVPIPHADAREAILRTAARRTPLDDSVDLAAVARDGRCAGFFWRRPRGTAARGCRRRTECHRRYRRSAACLGRALRGGVARDSTVGLAGRGAALPEARGATAHLACLRKISP